MWCFLLSAVGLLQTWPVASGRSAPPLPVLAPLSRYEAALLGRLAPEKLASLERRVNARHLLPRVRLYGNASAWDRIALDDATLPYRREGMAAGVSLEFRLPDLAYDAEERALLAEARAARKEQQELITQLHARWFDARALLAAAAAGPIADGDIEAIEAAVRAVEALAYGAAFLAAQEDP